MGRMASPYATPADVEAGIKVGTILVSRRGQAGLDFYKVMAITTSGKSATLQSIAQTFSPISERIVPLPDTFLTDRGAYNWGAPFQRRIGRDGFIRIDGASRSARRWWGDYA